MVDYAVRLMFVSEFDSVSPMYLCIFRSSSDLAFWVFSCKSIKQDLSRDPRLWPETLVAMGQIERNNIPARFFIGWRIYLYESGRLVFISWRKRHVKSLGIETSTYINNGVDIQSL